VAAECLEKRLKAAMDGAAQDPAIDLDLGHAGCALDLAGRRGADKKNLHALHRQLIRHQFFTVGAAGGSRNQWNR
jgi:hypothetical protein